MGLVPLKVKRKRNDFEQDDHNQKESIKVTKLLPINLQAA